jgi:excinuclease ABC subunit A
VENVAVTRTAGVVRIEGAAENNLRDVDVSIPGGITAVVGVSGSGKSSLVFDTLYRESRRRLLETLSLGSPWRRTSPARVRAIHGLGPAVMLAQNVLNRNPHSTLATAVGIHPFLRVLYARLGRRQCPACGAEVTTTSPDGQLAELRRLLRAGDGRVEVVAPLVRNAHGSHVRLLAWLTEQFGHEDVEVDGGRWDEGALDADAAHEISVRVAAVTPGARTPELRDALAAAEALGAPQVALRLGSGETRLLSRAPLCPDCGTRLPTLSPADFRDGAPDTATYRLGGRTLAELLRLDVTEAAAALEALPLPAATRAAGDHVRRRLSALQAVELGYLHLNRASPSLSRGEAQRVRLAVVLANRMEDVLHVLDEPTIGLDPDQVGSLMRQLARLRGPVVMVEHDAWAVAQADGVVELGPGAGREGGRVIFEGTPGRLWHADTASGSWFSGTTRARARETPRLRDEHVAVRAASLHNLRGFSCSFPVEALTVVVGPSGAGKTTLVREVLVESLRGGRPHGCGAVAGPALRPVLVDQSPIGRNPRSNPATYTGLASHIRAVFAAATDLPPAAFSFNRSEGSCPACRGNGAIEVELPFLPSEWVTCESCEGRRFSPEILDAEVTFSDGRARSIAEVYELTVEEARPLFADVPAARKTLRTLLDVGLGYVALGQSSPSLSGGEAQRVKLAKQLATARRGDLVVLDEPTTGLHPADLARLLSVLDRLVEGGCTVVVVEHHPEIVRAADWILRLGPGGGPDGGRLLHMGPPADATRELPRLRPRTAARKAGRTLPEIRIRGAAANNLRSISVDLPKGSLTAVVGVSGSGKSSLLVDVLAAEASRRLLECLSMYERQSVREGPEAPVRSVEGLGPTVAVGPDRRLWDPRSTVGTATEVSFHLGVLLAYGGERPCPRCGEPQRRSGPAPAAPWTCDSCGASSAGADPSSFSPATYAAACLTCGGLGTVQEPRVERLVVRPEAPLCGGAMHSPGFFPGSYLCKPQNGGYWMLQALGARYGFDPFETPWEAMTEDARGAFLFSDGEPVEIPSGTNRGTMRTATWRGFFRTVEGWDLGGLYTEHVPCPACAGGRLRPELLEVRLRGRNRHELHEAPIGDLAALVRDLELPDGVPGWVATSRLVAVRRLSFLIRVGLAYVNLDRRSSTLSAGELQRVRLAALLGAELAGVTVLLDEPTRGLHPREVEALGGALRALTDGGNTVVLVDHDPGLVALADHLVVLGPGAGRKGGKLLAAGSARDVRGSARRAVRDVLSAAAPGRVRGPRRSPEGCMVVEKPTQNNLCGEDVRLPLGVMTGLCGVSGSGKSTLAIDIVARALAPPRLTTSVAYSEVAPGAHAGIAGAPSRTVFADQTRAGIHTPGAFLGVLGTLRKAYAASDEALARGLREADLVPRCDVCHGRGSTREDMGFLPRLERPCDSCEATGYRAEARELAVRGRTLPELGALTIEQVLEAWGDLDSVARPLTTAVSLGLGYLVLAQRSSGLSGGEAQRLKLVRELGKERTEPTLYILDEPTVGLHEKDVVVLVDALDGLVGRGHSVLVVEHHPVVLACCDRLVELGPGGGPDGGRVVAEGTPEELAADGTPIAPYVREALS